MNEITSVALENEMDLILAHKQSMRLAELLGFSLPAQTTFATAVSEVSRNAIGSKGHLKLYIDQKSQSDKFIIAAIEVNGRNVLSAKDEAYIYAKKLVPNIKVLSENGISRTELMLKLPSNFRVDDSLIEKWVINLNNDPAISPYEEIKRKNRQLEELTARLRESEERYRNLTDSLPIMIFTSTYEGEITYANRWLYDYTGYTIESINEAKWANILHPDDFTSLWANRSSEVNDNIMYREFRIRDANTGEYRWHTGMCVAVWEDGKIKVRNNFLVDINAQKMIEQTLKDNKQLNDIKEELEKKVRELNLSNQQLEQFAYVASHDLQEPLRKISFYADFLKSRFASALPDEASVFFSNLINATERMRELINDVLAYSTLYTEDVAPVNLNYVATEALHDLEISIKEKQALINIHSLPVIKGNARQLKQLFENIISNSLKFSLPDITPAIGISATTEGNTITISFTDNGIGFDEKYMEKMFDLFQRLHPREKFRGTGIGLAICKKIVDLHNGSITATGIPGKGATFLISLPIQ